MILNLNSGIPKKYIDKGDSDNKDLINAEVQNRQSADNTLQGNINTEATTRKNADDALQALIDDLEEHNMTLGDVAYKNVGTTNGTIPIIGSNNKLDPSIMPDLAISEFKGTVSTVSGLTTLVSQTGDWAIVNGETDVSKNGSYILTAAAYGTASNWKKMATPDLVWGLITGNITAQADLKAALDAKLDASKYFGPTSAGTSGKQVFTGAGWATMPATWAEAPGGVEERAATPASVEFVRHYLQADFTAAKIFSFVGDLVEVSGVSLPDGYTKAYGTKDIEGNAPGYLVRHDSLNLGVVVMATPEPGKEIEWAEAEAKLMQVSAQTGGVSQYYYVIAKSDISALKVQVVVLDGNIMAYPDVERPLGEESSGV